MVANLLVSKTQKTKAQVSQSVCCANRSSTADPGAAPGRSLWDSCKPHNSLEVNQVNQKLSVYEHLTSSCSANTVWSLWTRAARQRITPCYDGHTSQLPECAPRRLPSSYSTAVTERGVSISAPLAQELTEKDRQVKYLQCPLWNRIFDRKPYS